MLSLVRILFHFVRSLFRSRADLEAENAMLRQQLIVAKRRAPKRVVITDMDRLILVWLCRLWPRLLDSMVIVQPETVLRWHRAGFRAFWRWKSRSAGGRPKIDAELRVLIRRMGREIVLWGAPRIHGELLKLGFEVSQSTVAKYMVRRPGQPSQGWRTFLRNYTSEIAAIDLLVVPTIGFNLLYVLVILRLDRRLLIWTSVTTNPTAEWIARQVSEAFPWDTAPGYLIRDNDGAYGEVFRRRLRAIGIRDRPTAPRSPWQNGYVERLIGSVRRECLDYVLVLGERHLQQILRTYAAYYNETRTHLALDKDAPRGRPVQINGAVTAAPVLGGLHHKYARMK
jgi:transposase InsO family protein